MNSRSLLANLSLAAVMALVLTGCFPIAGAAIGSGHVTTRDQDIAGFTSVDASNAFEVVITQSESFAVSVTADDNLWNQVIVTKNGDTLRLGLQPGAYTNTHLSAKISMPSLNKLSLSGACRATLSGFKSTSALSMELSGASQVTGDIQAGDATLRGSGASRYNLNGSADSLLVDASGATNADLPSFTVNKANVSLSGASRANINVKSNLDYDLSGASHLSFAGNPSMGRMSTSGASSVDHR